MIKKVNEILEWYYFRANISFKISVKNYRLTTLNITLFY